MSGCSRHEAHPLKITIGFVIGRAADNGDLPKWTAAAGSTWIAPAEPEIGATLGLMDLLRE